MSAAGFRLLFITADTFPPFRPDVKVLFGKELRRRGYRADWIMRSTDAHTPSGLLEWSGGTAWVAATQEGGGRLDRLRKHFASLRNDARVFGLARSGAYDFIQVKDKFLAALMAIVAARWYRVPCFYWLSFPYPEHSLESSRSPLCRYPFFYRVRGHFFTFVLYKVICRFADHVFVQSVEMRRAMSEKGVPAEKMTPVPMGVDLETVSVEDPAAPPLAERAPIVVYLGSLERARRLEFLLEVFAAVADSHADAKLYFVGGGDEPDDQPFLEREAERLGIGDRVVFTGFLPREEALRYVRAAAVCVALTAADSCYRVASSTKLIEYMALNKPVLANRHPDQEAVLRESGAGLCVPWDRQAFADALAWLLEHREEARAMGGRGRDYVRRKRAYRSIADDLDAQYRRLLQPRGLPDAPRPVPGRFPADGG